MILLGSGWYLWKGYDVHMTWGNKIIVGSDYLHLLACSKDREWNALYFEPCFNVEDERWKALK